MASRVVRLVTATGLLGLGALGMFGASGESASSPPMTAPEPPRAPPIEHQPLGNEVLEHAGSPVTPPPTPAPEPPRVAAPTFALSAPPHGNARIETPRGLLPVRIGKTEVTVERFRKCVRAGSCTSEHFDAVHDAPCNFAPDGRGAHPMNCVDWLGAQQYCAFDGGRLCTIDEWFAACRGPLDQDYPYGPAFDANACNAGQVAPSAETTPAGALRSCAEPSTDIRDMTGNVTEWIDDCKGTYCKMAGGAYRTNDPVDYFASCKRACSGNQKTFRSATVGFRCCYD